MANFGDKIVLEFQRVNDNSRSCEGCFFQTKGKMGCLVLDDSRIDCATLDQYKNVEYGIWARIDTQQRTDEQTR